MSTGRRLAKRSILGTRVAVPGQDDLLHAGQVAAVKTCGDTGGSGGGCRYSVRLDEPPRRVFEFAERDLVGPGFRGVSDVQLAPGQKVYVTHNQREMAGRVVRHDFHSQDVLLTVNNEEETVLLKIEDVRLLESRKSARLLNSDTDFSKLADLVISEKKTKPLTMNVTNGIPVHGSSKAIEMPTRSDYVQIAGSRKRRTSENVNEDEEVLSECSAAMLLLKLSCSPHSTPATNFFHHQLQQQQQQQKSSAPYKDLPSPAGSIASSSSGHASLCRSATPPSPPLSSSHTDEGIVRDFSGAARKRIIYQCTFPGCSCSYASVAAIEAHVRVEHLKRSAVGGDDDDEEFYYTEIEENLDDATPPPFPPATEAPPYLPQQQQQQQASPAASLNLLADHLDMARPAHEAPAGFGQHYRRKAHSGGNPQNLGHQGDGAQNLLSRSLPTQSPLSSRPVAIAPSGLGSPGKLIVISPPSLSPSTASSAKSPAGNTKSPNKRPRDGKKCRKVYGLEQRDLWCTQCKWKKACARFGAHATEPLQQQSLLVSTVKTNLNF